MWKMKNPGEDGENLRCVHIGGRELVYCQRINYYIRQILTGVTYEEGTRNHHVSSNETRRKEKEIKGGGASGRIPCW